MPSRLLSPENQSSCLLDLSCAQAVHRILCFPWISCLETTNKSVAHRSELHLFPNEEGETQVIEFADGDAEALEDDEDEADESLAGGGEEPDELLSTSIYKFRTTLPNKKQECNTETRM